MVRLRWAPASRRAPGLHYGVWLSIPEDLTASAAPSRW